MRVGDLVKVRTKDSPEKSRIGIVVRFRPKMYMVGNVVEVVIDGKIKYVKQEHAEVVTPKEKCHYEST